MTKAIILLSGGLDSTVVLALALSQNKTCIALSFDYGQKHLVELDAASNIAKYYQIPHKIIKIDSNTFANTSLISKSSLKIPLNRTLQDMEKGSIPNTYVPARNTLFLSYALGQCEIEEAQEIHFGPNKMDLVGYVDCRPTYIQAFQALMNVATKQAIQGFPPKLITPLINWDKAEIIKHGLELNAPLEMSFSCYNPKDSTPCLQCDPCILRADGFKKNNYPRPLI